MNAAFVVDASLALTWLFHDEATPHTLKLLERLEAERALVPAWWFLEVANVLALAERKNRITPAKTTEFIVLLQRLDFEIDMQLAERAFDDLLPLCRAHQLTSYDAVYLDVALRRQLPLATLDDPLRKAAKKLGVKLLGR